MPNQEWPFFPIPNFGETVYSVLCRCAERAGLPEQYLLRSLTAQRHKTTYLSALPGYLSSLARSMPSGHPWRNTELIVRDHTALPYYLYFDAQNERCFWTSRLATSASSLPIILSLGLTQYPCRGTAKKPSFCWKCFEEDLTRIGVGYFRREHQLPGIAVCWKHGEKLWCGCLTCGPYPIKKKALRTPGKCLCSNGITPLSTFPDLPLNYDALRWIAKESTFMVASSKTISKNIRSELKTFALKKGLARGSLLAYSDLADALESRFGVDVLQWLGTPAWNNKKPSAWVRRILYDQRVEQKRSPGIYFLLIIGVLFGSVAEFEIAVKNLRCDINASENDKKSNTNRILINCHAGNSVNKSWIRKTPTKDWHRLDQQKAEELKRVFEVLYNKTEKPIFASKSYGLQHVGLLRKYSSHPEYFPKVSAVLDDLAESRINFRKRRITWAVEQMVWKDKKLSVNGLRRVACLPAQVIREHKQLITDLALTLDIKINERSFFAFC